VFALDAKSHGKSPVLFAWHPKSSCVASVGSSRVVHVCDRAGLFIDTIELPLPSPCIALEWDERGEVLACMQESASELILWYLRDHKREHVELQIKDPSFMKFSSTCRGKDMVRVHRRSWFRDE
jgi:hypothetical protein